MTYFAVIVLAVGLLVIGIDMFAAPIRKRSISVPMVATAAGAGLGPLIGFGSLPQHIHFTILFDVASIALATGLLGTAVKLPPWDVFRRWRAMLVLLGIAMPLMWVAGGLVVRYSLGWSFTTAFLVGACIAPTDPVLSRTIVLGEIAARDVPEPLRYTILDESAANDGAAYPIVTLMIALAGTAHFSTAHWLLAEFVWAVLGSVALGLAIGVVAAYVQRYGTRLGKQASPTFHLAFPMALAIITLMTLRLLRADGVLGVFFAGVSYNVFRERGSETDEAEVQELVDNVFSVALFFVFGLAIPWSGLQALGWRLVPLLAGILLLRRLPWLLVLQPLLRRQIPTLRQAAFDGWFGPMGVSALFYAALAVDATGVAQVWPVVAAVVLASIFVHGITGRALTVRLPLGRARSGRTDAGSRR